MRRRTLDGEGGLEPGGDVCMSLGLQVERPRNVDQPIRRTGGVGLEADGVNAGGQSGEGAEETLALVRGAGGTGALDAGCQPSSRRSR